MVLMIDGSVWSTGRNMHGQLGDGSTVDRTSFVQVISTGALSIAAGGVHSMALTRESGYVVLATGGNMWGQLGDGSTTSKNSFGIVASAGVGTWCCGACITSRTLGCFFGSQMCTKMCHCVLAKNIVFWSHIH